MLINCDKLRLRHIRLLTSPPTKKTRKGLFSLVEYDRCRTRVHDSKVESNPDVQSADKLFEPFVFGKAAVQAFPHPWPRVDWVVLGIASSHGICAPAIQTDDLDLT